MSRAREKKADRTSLKLIYGRILKHKKALFLGILALVGVDGLQLVVPLIFRRVIDALASGDVTSGFIWKMGLAVVAVSLGMAVCRFFWRWFIVGASHRIDRDLRSEFYTHLQALPADYFDKTKVGDVMAHATNDINAVRMACGMATIASFDAIFMSAASIIMLITIDWKLTLVTMIPLPLIALMVTRFSGMIHDRFDKVQMAFSELSDKAQEAFSGIRVVKAYGDEESENGLFDAKARLNMDQNIHLARVWGFFQPLVATLALAGNAILLAAGGRMVIGGSISLGQFVAFSSYLAMLTWPMMAIGFVVNMLQRGAASMARLMRIINTVPSISDGSDPAVPEPVIEVRNLTFAYPDTGTNVLEEVAFSLESGRTLGIVGRTGSGKTTLVELLMRLYDPPRGTVFVGGRDVADLKLHNLRGLFGYVPQETFLFAMTIGDNIAFGAGPLPAERVRELAETVDIASEIEGFPQGFETVVGERGVTLSGGQKQRVAIARALATNPGILVLDDSLSAVDTETEDVILKAVKRKTSNITTIIISHRISTVQHADMVLVMERGRIVEKGTHEQLLSKDGFYTELYRMQQLEAEAQKTSGGGDD